MTSNEPYQYIGKELAFFQHAHRWKDYFGGRLSTSIRGDVLEVGAGIGANTKLLCRPPIRSWTCLEPDERLGRQLANIISATPNFVVPPELVIGTIQQLPVGLQYDTILYIDVLEHISDDQAEVAMAANRLRSKGRLIVLAPAHPFLFTPFDEAIGHYRRYNARMVKALKPPGCRLVRWFYLDSCGLLASLGNRFFLRSSSPTRNQIMFWDRILVPASRLVDPLSLWCFGKSIIAIWEKEGESNG